MSIWLLKALLQSSSAVGALQCSFVTFCVYGAFLDLLKSVGATRFGRWSNTYWDNSDSRVHIYSEGGARCKRRRWYLSNLQQLSSQTGSCNWQLAVSACFEAYWRPRAFQFKCLRTPFDSVPALMTVATHRCTELDWGQTVLRDGFFSCRFDTGALYGLGMILCRIPAELGGCFCPYKNFFPGSAFGVPCQREACQFWEHQSKLRQVSWCGWAFWWGRCKKDEEGLDFDSLQENDLLCTKTVDLDTMSGETLLVMSSPIQQRVTRCACSRKVTWACSLFSLVRCSGHITIQWGYSLYIDRAWTQYSTAEA